MTSDSAHVLVVDDTEASRYVRASWLRRGGHRVTEAVAGGQALELLAAQEFDIVVLDVDLPDMNGFDVAERIKGDPRTAAIPVVHVSAAFREAEDRITGLNRGADAYLTEPVDAGELMATVQAALRYYRARTLAERLADRLAKLTAGTMAINAATEFDTLATEAARATATVLAAPATAIGPAADGGRWIARATVDGEVDVIRGTAFDEPPVGMSTVTDPPWSPGTPSAVVLARGTPTRPAVLLAVPPEAVATDEDRTLLVQLAQATALAAEGLWAYVEEHKLALVLQRSLLPRELPVVPSLPMAARYQPASSHAEIGGDFYEVTRLGDRLLIAIGDVCGHSIGAATIMGEVRHALRAYAVEEEDPARILRKLDAMLSRFHSTKGLTTMCLLLVDPADGATAVANAGHVPPLVADHTGTEYLAVRGPLLGIDLPRPPSTHLVLPPGALVLLTTDGLVEHTGTDLDDGMNQLRDAVRPDVDMNALCDDLLERFGRDKKDDIALFAFRRPVGAPSAGEET